jgi:hypothetical protein
VEAILGGYGLTNQLCDTDAEALKFRAIAHGSNPQFKHLKISVVTR